VKQVPLSEIEVGGAGGSKTQIHTKVENPPSLPMEAYLESQWPPLHRVHNLYVKHICAVIIPLPNHTPEKKAQKNPGAKTLKVEKPQTLMLTQDAGTHADSKEEGSLRSCVQLLFSVQGNKVSSAS